MYFIDSATQGVDVFDYDVGAGSVGNRRRLVTIERAHGIPDGMTADNQGNLWVACFGGAAVRCFSPLGVLLEEVFFPVSQVTSCAFGGPELADLYVTSAAYRLSTDQLKRQPHAGATFVCRPGAVGHACIVVRRVEGGSLITGLQPDRRTPPGRSRRSCRNTALRDAGQASITECPARSRV